LKKISSYQVYVSSVAIVTLALTFNAQSILRHFGFYRALYRQFPFYVPGTLRTFLEVLLILGALYIVHRLGPRRSLRELYLAGPVLPGLLFGFVVALPMLLGFALTRRPAPDLSLANVSFLAVFFPLAEEIQFRGYAIGQLYRRAGWSSWLAILFVAIFFGLGHIEKGQSFSQMAGLFLLTGLGGATFSWLLIKWQSLWVPFSIHMFMNLWWEVFSVSRTALGGWFPLALQIITAILAIMGTLYLKRPRRSLS